MTMKLKVDEVSKLVEDRKERREPPPVRYRPNLTPLIDVLFLLLLFFLLGTKFRQSEGLIPASLPDLGSGGAGSQVEALLTPIKINIDPRGPNNLMAQYEIGNNLLPARNGEELYRKLEAQSRAAGPQRPILIKARADVRWEFVIEASNQAKRAKFQNIGFAPVGS